MTLSRHSPVRLAAMILAIYALVLSGLFGALLQGESVGARLLAAELGVLCAPSGHSPDAPLERNHDGSCCLTACRGIGAGPALLPQALALAEAEWHAIAPPATRHDTATIVSSTRLPPARGPPLAA